MYRCNAVALLLARSAGTCTRSLCTSAEQSQSTSLKASLRALYKQVHPDLFHDYPTEKAENEKSFKLLQEYLRQAREGDSASPEARVPYNFIFHIRPPEPEQSALDPHHCPPTSDSSPPQDGTPPPPPPPLNRVAVTLPPPTRAPGPHHQVSSLVLKALSRLLSACGVHTPISPHATQDGAPTRLLHFLPDALEEARQKEAGGVSASVQIANIRGAMRLSRQVLVRSSDSHPPADQQLQQLQRLARALQAVPWLDLRGCTLGVLAPRTSLDSTGVLWLSPEDSEETWVDFLTQVDLQYARQLLANVRALRQLEHSVAAAVGVATICTAPSVMMAPPYRQLLERLAADALERGQVAGGELKQVPVYVGPPSPLSSAPLDPPPEIMEDASTCRVDPHLGSVHLPVNISAAACRTWLQGNAAQVLAARRQQQRAEAEAKELIDRTRATLRLRRLLWDRDSVSPQQLRVCLREMLAMREPLMELLEGMSVRVGGRHGVASDGSYVEIPWNFEL